MIRVYVAAAAAAAFLAGAPAFASNFIEEGTHRHGSTFAVASYRAAGGSLEAIQLCQEICAGESRCVAWSYVRPGVRGPQAQCELKSSVTPGEANPCCDSGVITERDRAAIARPAVTPARATAAPLSPAARPSAPVSRPTPARPLETPPSDMAPTAKAPSALAPRILPTPSPESRDDALLGAPIGSTVSASARTGGSAAPVPPGLILPPAPQADPALMAAPSEPTRVAPIAPPTAAAPRPARAPADPSIYPNYSVINPMNETPSWRVAPETAAPAPDAAGAVEEVPFADAAPAGVEIIPFSDAPMMDDLAETGARSKAAIQRGRRP